MIKRVKMVLLTLFTLPIVYLMVSLILTYIPSGEYSRNSEQEIYIHTNGVHLDLILPISSLDSLFIENLNLASSTKYLSFGWGDEDFYLNTPNWSDLKFSNAFKALFMKSSTLMHVTRHHTSRESWKKITCSKKQLQTLTAYIKTTFLRDEDKRTIILPNRGYSSNDDFYRAKGSYSCVYTCNSWINTALKTAGLKSSVWTPFDFGVIGRY